MLDRYPHPDIDADKRYWVCGEQDGGCKSITTNGATVNEDSYSINYYPDGIEMANGRLVMWIDDYGSAGCPSHSEGTRSWMG